MYSGWSKFSFPRITSCINTHNSIDIPSTSSHYCSFLWLYSDYVPLGIQSRAGVILSAVRDICCSIRDEAWDRRRKLFLLSRIALRSLHRLVYCRRWTKFWLRGTWSFVSFVYNFVSPYLLYMLMYLVLVYHCLDFLPSESLVLSCFSSTQLDVVLVITHFRRSQLNYYWNQRASESVLLSRCQPGRQGKTLDNPRPATTSNDQPRLASLSLDTFWK